MIAPAELVAAMRAESPARRSTPLGSRRVTEGLNPEATTIHGSKPVSTNRRRGANTSHARSGQEMLTVVGERVRALRIAQGWSGERLAHESSLTISTVSKTERGEREPLSTVMLLMGALAVTPAELPGRHTCVSQEAFLVSERHAMTHRSTLRGRRHCESPCSAPCTDSSEITPRPPSYSDGR